MLRPLSLLFLLLLALTGFRSSQSDEVPPGPEKGPATVFIPMEGNRQWLSVKPGYALSTEALLSKHLAELGFGPQDELRQYRTQKDQIGMVHHRYQHYHRGIEVDGSELLIHERDGQVQTLNGKWPVGLDKEARVLISPEEALQLALRHMPASRYMWEYPEAERMLQKVRRDPKASFRPVPELVWVDPALEQEAADYRLAYRMTVHTKLPVEERKQLYIDARNGEPILKLEMLCDNNDTPATAETKYNGTRQIITDSVSADTFRLIETGRGGGIETYDAKRSENEDLAVNFYDNDNYWDNRNSRQDEAATDAHWGAEMTFDYFLHKHNYVGIDGDSMPLINYVHYSNAWVNAQWTGNWARYGDGDGSNYTALTSIDVVAHEFLHGVTDFTSDLIYQDESGALNESFSDIFGTVVEFWAGAEPDWTIGEDFHLTGDGFRDMANPNIDSDPDTYFGRFWLTGTSDNGGVHTNSGVQNHWFYLLTEGGSGNNDNGEQFEVKALGMDTAAAIAFRNMQFYLARRSQYIDARLGSIQAAEDLYGRCSEASLETTKAWYATGVGYEAKGQDVSLMRFNGLEDIECAFGPNEGFSISFRYEGCPEDPMAGDRIPIGFQIDEGEVLWDTLTLSAALSFGDTLDYTLQTPAQALAIPGRHHLRCWLALDTDGNTTNDTIEIQLESILEQNSDLRLEEVQYPNSGCFQFDEEVVLTASFYGCDSLPAGEQAEAFYRLNDGPVVSETFTLPNTLYPGDTITYRFEQRVNIPRENDNKLDAWLRFSPDLILENDSIYARVVANPSAILPRRLINFELGEASLNSFYLETGTAASAGLAEDPLDAANTIIRMTGGDLLNTVEEGNYSIPKEDNVWNTNEASSAKMCFCADLRGLDTAILRFDLRQAYSPFYLQQFSENVPLASALRILVNGEQVGETFKPSTFVNDGWRTRRIDLTSFRDSPAEICFEARNGIATEFDPLNRGDNVFIDNITFGNGDFVPVGQKDIAPAEAQFSLSPNPSNGQFQLVLETASREEATVEIFNAYGQRIKQIRFSPAQGAVDLDLRAQPAGVYYLRLHQDGKEAVKPVIIE